MDRKEIRRAQDLLHKAMENLKKDVSKELGNTPHLEGVRPMEGSVRCGVVSFSAIAASPGRVLSARTAKGERTFLNPNTVATLERIQAELA